MKRRRQCLSIFAITLERPCFPPNKNPLGWDPGDDYVDIVGSDNYAKSTTNKKAWNKLTDNKDERLKEVFNSDLVITLDELPKFE